MTEITVEVGGEYASLYERLSGEPIQEGTDTFSVLLEDWIHQMAQEHRRQEQQKQKQVAEELSELSGAEQRLG